MQMALRSKSLTRQKPSGQWGGKQRRAQGSHRPIRFIRVVVGRAAGRVLDAFLPQLLLSIHPRAR